MATCGTPSSLMLRHASPSVHPPDITPSLRCFIPKPLFRAFCLYPLVLAPRGRNPSLWVNVNLQREDDSRSYQAVLAALASRSEVAETAGDKDEGEEGGDGSMANAVTTPEPKKVKAALPTKEDRVVITALGYRFQRLLPIYGGNRRSKRFLEIQGLSENKREYDMKTAISMLKETANTKFVETIEAHFRLDIDPKYTDQQLKATVNFPKGIGKAVKVAVLTREKLDEAKNAGADLVGGEDLIERIKGGFMDFDKLISSPDLMPKVADLRKILGPKGLMPNPKAGTITDNIPQAIEEFKQGKIEYKADKTGIVHLAFGKVDFPVEELLANLIAAIQSIEANRPSGIRGVYWKSAHICSAMGPSLRLSIREILDCRPPSDLCRVDHL